MTLKAVYKIMRGIEMADWRKVGESKTIEHKLKTKGKELKRAREVGFSHLAVDIWNECQRKC